MLKVENKINPGRNGMKIFGESFMVPVEFEGLGYEVMAEIRVYSNDIKLGDLVNLEYVNEVEEVRGFGRTYIRLAHKVPVRNKVGGISWFWTERAVYLDDILDMIDAPVLDNSLPENYIVGVIK